jgi:hypothetical protein
MIIIIMSTTKRFIAKNGIDGNSITISNVANPVNSQDVITKNYLISNSIIKDSLGNYKGSLSELLNNTTGSDNIAIGNSALLSNISGIGSVAVGYQSQKYVNPNASSWTNYNTSIGYQSLQGSSTASSNTGNYNTSIGYQSLLITSTGTGNTAIGYSSLIANDTGNYNTSIGYQSGLTVNNISYSTAIGASSNVTTSNTVVLGRTTDVTVIGASSDDLSGNKLQVSGTVSATTPTNGDNSTKVATTAFVNTYSQPKHANLTTISSLSTSISGLVTFTNGVASLDTNTYLTTSGNAASASLLTNTNLGSTEATNNTTTNTAALWAALPIGYSSYMASTIGTGAGLPVANNGYFHKVATRPTGGGWGGIWCGYSVDQNYIGRATTSIALPSWDKLLIDGGSGSITGNASTSTKIATARNISMTGDGTWTVSFDGSGDATAALTLATVATAGTYKSVTIDVKGRVTAGTNPTTLAGYGITDAALLASPTFTGTPAAPTATSGTNTTQIATTAFVSTAISNATLSAGAGSNGTTTINTGTAGTHTNSFSYIITGQTSILTTSKLSAEFNLSTGTSDHSIDEVIIDDVQVWAGNIIAGVSFTIYITQRTGTLYGNYIVDWYWI